jgi:hypothetical protein
MLQVIILRAKSWKKYSHTEQKIKKRRRGGQVAHCLKMKGEIYTYTARLSNKPFKSQKFAWDTQTLSQQCGFISLLTKIRGTQIQIAKLYHKDKKLWGTHRQMNTMTRTDTQTNKQQAFVCFSSK